MARIAALIGTRIGMGLVAATMMRRRPGKVTRTIQAMSLTISMGIYRMTVAIGLGSVIAARLVIVITTTGVVVVAASIGIIAPMAVIGAHKAEADRAISRRTTISAVAPIIAIVCARAQEQDSETGDQRKK